MKRKICYACKKRLPLDKFPRDRNRPDGRFCYCRPCHVKRTKRWQQANPDKHKLNVARQRQRYVDYKLKFPDKRRRELRSASLRRRYGITLTRYNEMLTEQGGGCAFCSRRPSQERFKSLFVDHDHSCCPGGYGGCGLCVRWLLCSSCNFMIGAARDRPEVLRKAATALVRWRRLYKRPLT